MSIRRWVADRLFALAARIAPPTISVSVKVSAAEVHQALERMTR